MAKKPNKTTLEYRKQRKRVQSAIKRLEKRGYVVPENLLPDIPKNITPASVRRLQKIDINKIYKKSVKVDFETGEITPGIVAREKARSEAAKRAAKTRKERKLAERTREVEIRYTPQEPPKYSSFPNEADIIIQNFRADVIARFPENAGPILERWLTDLERLYDRNDIATMLQEAANNGVMIDYKVAYNNDMLMGAIADFMDFLPDASEGVKQDLMDAIEYNEDWELPE